MRGRHTGRYTGRLRSAGLVRRDPHAYLRRGVDVRGADLGRAGERQGRLAGLPAACDLQRGALLRAADVGGPVHAVGDGGGGRLPATRPRGVLVLPGLLGEALSAAKVVGLLLGFCGVVVVSAESPSGASLGTPLGTPLGVAFGVASE